MKEHECDCCVNPINKGDYYFKAKYRLPRFIDDVQVGIEYMTLKTCLSCREIEDKEANDFKDIVESEEYKYVESCQEHRYP